MIDSKPGTTTKLNRSHTQSSWCADLAHRSDRQTWPNRNMHVPKQLGTFLFCAVAMLGADITGKWNFVWQTEGGERQTVLTIKQNADWVEAFFADAKEPITGTLKDGKLALSGKVFSSEAGTSAEFRLDGVLSGSDLKGTGSWGEHEVVFTARKAE